MSDSGPMFLPDLISMTLTRDLEIAEERHLREKAEREELRARTKAEGEMNVSQLMKAMYGSEDAAPAAPPLKPVAATPTQEKRDGKPVERFPAPPTGARR